jgi:hypothetical protein
LLVQEKWLVKQRAALAAAVAAADAARTAKPGAAPANSNTSASADSAAVATPAAAPSDMNASTDAAATAAGGVAAKPEQETAAEAKERKAELDARVKLLEGHADSYSDPGPMVHCVVWHDKDAWRAALDTSELFDFFDEAGTGEEGKVADFTPMTDFRCAGPRALLQHPMRLQQCCEWHATALSALHPFPSSLSCMSC